MRRKCSHPDCDKWANAGIVRKTGNYSFHYCTNKHAMHDYERRVRSAEHQKAGDHVDGMDRDDLGESPDF